VFDAAGAVRASHSVDGDGEGFDRHTYMMQQARRAAAGECAKRTQTEGITGVPKRGLGRFDGTNPNFDLLCASRLCLLRLDPNEKTQGSLRTSRKVPCVRVVALPIFRMTYRVKGFGGICRGSALQSAKDFRFWALPSATPQWRAGSNSSIGLPSGSSI
jgi:hypothetical protein